MTTKEKDEPDGENSGDIPNPILEAMAMPAPESIMPPPAPVVPPASFETEAPVSASIVPPAAPASPPPPLAEPAPLQPSPASPPASIVEAPSQTPAEPESKGDLSDNDMATLQKQYGLSSQTMQSQGYTTPPAATAAPPPASIVSAQNPIGSPTPAPPVQGIPKSTINPSGFAPPTAEDSAFSQLAAGGAAPESIVGAGEAGAGAAETIGAGAAGGPAGLAIGAAVAGITAGLHAAKSPQGSISQFLPAPGGGGQDYAGQAAQQALLAALNSSGGIASRMGG